MKKHIFDHSPDSWQELEKMVLQAFLEMRYKAERNFEVSTVRGKVKIDVYAENEQNPIPTIILCECKHWNKNVDQNVVYSFRSICDDIGAHYGLIISKKGFQSGAETTREATNIHLLDFDQFQQTFYDEWRNGVFMTLTQMRDKLIPLVPGNPNSTINAKLLKSYDPSYLFDKYSIFFGYLHVYTAFYV
jgi:hypothetical protein